jgi:hypothetical protein
MDARNSQIIVFTMMYKNVARRCTFASLSWCIPLDGSIQC